ncbi:MULTISPECIES: Maf family protein [Comamonas]|jgi:septum formation protein|uniref:dTTP/UTP pyrophosphatase n=1 Tax=Comamonas terrigena TaxID=32013 RepID=A0A2A7UVX6_COMTR|nr:MULTISPECIES: Maf family protein [Comamonas]MBD9531616.1 septum formation inhibitor Maf [Comamonas sp. CMM01]MDH1290580.1 Maf family nucleotide pyrophosphatase [Comamonas terrigena]PEH89509.1 septum formation inhibitor Maf [Comamonas terrigena]SUY71723.1 Maf-like protein yhdE [Comamonas terrigena]BBL24685.1 Maf-like protein [Comamonas terrigena NBRC 13299]
MTALPYLYLASQSPRRSQLLEQMGVRHVLLLPNVQGDVAEDAEAIEAVLPGETPRDYVVRVTGLKLDAAVARHARRQLAQAPILCSDTTVALGTQILGKPADAADADRMLRQLAGQTHEVLTAVALQDGGQRRTALSISQVTFAAMTEAQIAAYVASGEPMGKAGSYGIQGRAAAHVAHMAGSYSGIMGLPVYETAQLLRQAGWPL